MHQSSLSDVLTRATDGHPADAAEAARQSLADERVSSAERLVLVALLRHAREKTLKARLFGDPLGSESNYSYAQSQSAGN
jgi:hypothetical protein